MDTHSLSRLLIVLTLIPTTVVAQTKRDDVPLTSWPAPLLWQPNEAEMRLAAAAKSDPDSISAESTTPANSLVFVGMTPCRIADTRNAGFPAGFGPPSLSGGINRTFVIQSVTSPCPVPSIAQAYSFNITIVPSGFVDFITVWPTGQVRPLASTLNGYVGTVIANAAIAPAGLNGSIDVYASQNTDLVIDINGYYAPMTGLTLAQGVAASPSLSFANDVGTGIFSSGAGRLNISTAGVSRLAIRSDGDLDLAGNVRKGGSYFLHNLGTSSTGTGIDALRFNTGDNNTATGSRALEFNTTGDANSAHGAAALAANSTGSSNTAAGYGALNGNTTGSNNTAVGALSMTVNTVGINNTAIGMGALNANTSGHENTAVGLSALQNNTSAFANTAVGYHALRLTTTGSQNTASGYRALFGNTEGISNTAAGFSALESNTTGDGNTAVGWLALPNNTTGFANTAIGRSTLSAVTTGIRNTALGIEALSAITGNDNIGIGTFAGSSIVAGSNNIVIGSLVTGNAADSGAIRIGGISQTRAFVAGIRGTTTGQANAVNVVIDSAGQLGTLNSSRRFKEDIQDMNDASNGLLRLRPVTFRYTQPYEDGAKPVDYGLIAEEVAEVFPDLVVKAPDGQTETVQYHKLTPMLLNEVQKQYQQIERQAETIRLLQTRLEALEALLSSR